MPAQITVVVSLQFLVRIVSDLTCCQADVPQFLVYTADDAVQSYTIDSVNQFLAQRKNPNGCPPRMTYYVSLNYTNYTLVTDWFVAGNEIADHTLGHFYPLPFDLF